MSRIKGSGEPKKLDPMTFSIRTLKAAGLTSLETLTKLEKKYPGLTLAQVNKAYGRIGAAA